MTSGTSLESSPARTPPTSAAPTESRWHRPPVWLWLVSLVAQTAVAAALTSYTYFFVDDFLFLRQAQTQAVSLSYLRDGLFEHFSPISRLLDKALVAISPGSFGLAHGVELALYCAAVAAFALAVGVILGRTWMAFGLTVLFGQSLFLIHLLNWWTATANILPSTIFILLAFAGYLRWRQTRSRWWLAASVLAYAGSLLDYETGMLFPVYLFVVVVLVLEDDLDPRAWLRLLWRERAAWLWFAVLEVLALYNYYRFYYAVHPHPTPGQLIHFLEIALLEAFVPAVVGIADPQAAISASPVVIVLAGLVVGTAVALVLYLRPRAWRCLAAFVAVFLVSMVPVGLNRVRLFGVQDGHQLYYQQSVQFMFLLLTAFAFSVYVPARMGGAGWVERAGARLRGRGTVALCLLAFGAYGALFVSSAIAMGNASAEPHRSRAYIETFKASVRRARALTRASPVLVDHDVPGDIVPTAFPPFNRYDEFFALVDPSVPTDRAGGPTYVVDEAGRLLPVRYLPVAAGRLDRASLYDPDGTVIGKPMRGSPASSVCVPAARHLTRLRVPLATTTRISTQSSGLPYAVRLSIHARDRATVPVLLENRGGTSLDAGFPLNVRAGAQDVFAVLTLGTTVDQVGLDLPGGACVDRLSLGRFEFSGPPVSP